MADKARFRSRLGAARSVRHHHPWHPADRVPLGAVRLEVLGADVRNQGVIAARLPQDHPEVIIVTDRYRYKPERMSINGPKRSAAR
jgi:hypothetical protein